MTIFSKDPDAILDYTINWDDGYLENGESITASSWSSYPTGLTLSATTHTTGTATVTVSGGIHAVTYVINNHVVTSKNGREDERSITLRIWEPL
jgi:hypothetical protein